MAIVIIPTAPSRNIVEVGYDSQEMTLLVEFKEGAIYRYSPVPGDVANGFSQSLNTNDYFKANIKDNFEYERVA